MKHLFLLLIIVSAMPGVRGKVKAPSTSAEAEENNAPNTTKDVTKNQKNAPRLQKRRIAAAVSLDGAVQ